MSDTFTFSEDAAGGLIRDHRRLAKMPTIPQASRPGDLLTDPARHWVYLTTPKTYAQSGDTGSNVYVSSSPSGVTLGSRTSVGVAGMYFNEVIGHPANAGVKLLPALTSFDGTFLELTRTGLYEVTMRTAVQLLYAYHATGTRVITTSLGSPDLSGHTHSVTVPYPDPTSVITYRVALWTRAGSTGSTSGTAPYFYYHRFPFPNYGVASGSGDVFDSQTYTFIRHAKAGEQWRLQWVGGGSPSGHISTVYDGAMYIRWMGDGPSAKRTLASFQSENESS